jgi:hypothetical protein
LERTFAEAVDVIRTKVELDLGEFITTIVDILQEKVPMLLRDEKTVEQ